jgi:hypothetical protein
MTIPKGSAPGSPVEHGSGQHWASTSLLEAFADEFNGVEDLVALTGAHVPAWVDALPVPPHWQRVDLPETEVAVAPARVAVWGSRAEGGWEATDTLEVYAFTGRPAFSVVLGSTARVLGYLGACDITTRMLAVPATVGVAAERSSAVVAVGDRRIWTQLTHYVAGSGVPRAGRLVVHGLYVAADREPTLAPDITVLTESVQDTFVALFTTPGPGGGG